MIYGTVRKLVYFLGKNVLQYRLVVVVGVPVSM